MKLKTKKTCDGCGKKYFPSCSFQMYCSKECSRFRSSGLEENLSTDTVGAVAMTYIAADLMSNGYSVFFPYKYTDFCDLVAIKDGVVRIIECRMAQERLHDRKFVCGKHYRKGVTEIAAYLPMSKTVEYLSVNPLLGKA